MKQHSITTARLSAVETIVLRIWNSFELLEDVWVRNIEIRGSEMENLDDCFIALRLDAKEAEIHSRRREEVLIGIAEPGNGMRTFRLTQVLTKGLDEIVRMRRISFDDVDRNS